LFIESVVFEMGHVHSSLFDLCITCYIEKAFGKDLEETHALAINILGKELVQNMALDNQICGTHHVLISKIVCGGYFDQFGKFWIWFGYFVVCLSSILVFKFVG